MHFNHGEVPARYQQYLARKIFFIIGLVAVLAVAFLVSLSCGSANLDWKDVLQTLFGVHISPRLTAIVWNIRMPQALTGIVAGAGLAVTGTVMQSILRNPLGSPFTLGISHGAAFGAAFSVMILDGGILQSGTGPGVTVTNPWITTGAAFAGSLAAAVLIVALARLRSSNPETLILTGVALGALFTAGTMFLQFFADDVQLAAMVFWTFGDTARATYGELLLIAAVLVVCVLYFYANSWSYNAMDSGDETALGLGVRVERLRLTGMLLASLVTAVIIAFLGIIGFVGLIVPHMVRRIIGSDHRFLIPAAMLCGASLLLVSDTVARTILQPHVLPVSVLTAFLGAPTFFWLILRRGRS